MAARGCSATGSETSRAPYELPLRAADAAVRLGQAGGPLSDKEIVLYRCQTPTNLLCPCGAVARRLKKLDLEYRTERVALRRADRPEIVELTGQNRVPVLIDGKEVVHDSKRILQYLEYSESKPNVPETP